MNKYVKVKSIVYETNNAFTIKFENDPIFNSYKSGQFTNVFVTINGEEVSRSYSFSSSPKIQELPAITIKRVNDGLVSNYLFKNIRINEGLLISEPSGRFETHNFGKKRKVFIAGGSGITPIFSMIKSILSESDDHILLLYAIQNIESIIFKSKLTELTEQFNDRLEVIHYLKEIPLEPTNLKINSGRIDREKLQKLLIDTSSIDSVYLCGPSTMMQSITKCLEEFGIDSERIFTENFTSGMKDYSAEQPNKSFTSLNIFIGDNSINIKVERSRPILQSALDEGIKLPHSCQEALCGSCKVRLLKGKVNMIENYALADEEVSNGMILPCSSLPVSDHLELAY